MGKQECFFVEIDEGTESGRKRWRDKSGRCRGVQSGGSLCS